MPEGYDARSGRRTTIPVEAGRLPYDLAFGPGDQQLKRHELAFGPAWGGRQLQPIEAQPGGQSVASDPDDPVQLLAALAGPAAGMGGRALEGALARRAAGREAASMGPLSRLPMTTAGPGNTAGVGGPAPFIPYEPPPPIPRSAPELGALPPLDVPAAAYGGGRSLPPMPPAGRTFTGWPEQAAADAEYARLGQAYHLLHGVRGETPAGGGGGFRVNPADVAGARQMLGSADARGMLPPEMQTPSVMREINTFAAPPPMSDSPLAGLLRDTVAGRKRK